MNLSFVALRVTRYSDSQSILTAYSRELGRVALALPAGTGRAAARMRALTMPLGVVDCLTDRRPGREVLPMRQASQAFALSSLHSDPVKQMVAMMLAEVLSATLQTGEPDGALFDYLVAAIRFLDAADARQTANFHICFLYHLGRHLGIEPDVSTYVGGSVLDFADGCWRPVAPLHSRYLSPEDSRAAFLLARMTFSNLHRYRFNREQRNRITDAILEYYSIHYVSLRNMRSLDIVRGML